MQLDKLRGRTVSVPSTQAAPASPPARHGVPDDDVPGVPDPGEPSGFDEDTLQTGRGWKPAPDNRRAPPRPLGGLPAGVSSVHGGAGRPASALPPRGVPRGQPRGRWARTAGRKLGHRTVGGTFHW